MGLSNMYNPYTISILFKIFVVRIIITHYGKSYWPSGTKERHFGFLTHLMMVRLEHWAVGKSWMKEPPY